MNTFGIGNSGTCIIRSSRAGQRIGDLVSTYANEPYTIINGEFDLSFDNNENNSDSMYDVLTYNYSFLNRITFSNITLTSKILKLIFPKSEEKIISYSEYFNSDEEKVLYLNFKGRDAIYQVFVYDGDGKLEAAYGELTESALEVLQENTDYLVVYSVLCENSLNLDDTNREYFTLDIQSKANDENDSKNCHIHIEKAALRISKNMSFDNGLNTVDITFTVIKDKNHQSGENYMILED